MDEGERAEQTALAEQLLEDGEDFLEEGSFVDACDQLAQCLEIKTAMHGEDSVEAALVFIRYGKALLGSARHALKDDVLGAKGKAALQARLVAMYLLEPVLQDVQTSEGVFCVGRMCLHTADDAVLHQLASAKQGRMLQDSCSTPRIAACIETAAARSAPCCDNKCRQRAGT